MTAFLSAWNKNLFAQANSDAKFIFKTWLFLEHNNTKSRDATLFPVKDSSVFDLFQNGLELKFDTLKSAGFSKDYEFLLISFIDQMRQTKFDAIRYTKKKLVEYLSTPVDNCNGYVLCINKSKGTSYRLMGFGGNDFLNLFHEVQSDYANDTKVVIKIKQFLKDYSVEGVDFVCLFEGLTSRRDNFNNFPCLRKCSDIYVTIH
jgi:hypothetical protein